MDLERLTASLAQFPAALRAAVGGMGEGDLRWRPSDGAWSALEVIGHLADEEERDFPLRLKMLIERPGEAWPGIDPEGWAVEHRYNEATPGDVLARFEALRAASVAWLNGLDGTDWEAAYEHPLGPLRAGDLLAAWVAHDWLHLRQVAKRRYELAVRDGLPYESMYAGEWLA